MILQDGLEKTRQLYLSILLRHQTLQMRQELLSLLNYKLTLKFISALITSQQLSRYEQSIHNTHTLNDVNELLAVLVGAATLVYMVLKIIGELRKKKDK
jgi:hypothetical protein